MSYTAPTTRTTGTLITASIWNTDIVDNIVYLKADMDTKYYNHGWIPVTGTWTYASASTITVPSGAANIYNKGDKIRWKQGGGWKYGNIANVADTLLTIFVNTDYTVANAAITDVYYSKIQNPLDFPNVFNWAVTHGGFSSAPATYAARYSISGKQCRINYNGGNGTSNAATFTVSLPVTAAAYQSDTALGIYTDNSATGGPGLVEIVASASVATLYKAGIAGWTSSGQKGGSFQIVYEY